MPNNTTQPTPDPNPSPVRYREIADDLRRKIEEGEYAAGAKIPTFAQLMNIYEAGSNTVREAVNVLCVEGYVRSVRKLGTVVLDRRSSVERLDRGRDVRRNEYGYFFNAVSGHWGATAIRPPTWTEADAEVAGRLGIAIGTLVLIRWRAVGPDKDRPLQLTRTCIVEDLARGTAIERNDTGPGGWMERAEQDLGHGPLSWEEYAATRMPTRDEVRALKIHKQMPVMVLTRVTTSGTTGLPVAVDITVMSGMSFEIRYPLVRDRSARWPTTPATDRNIPY